MSPQSPVLFRILGPLEVLVNGRPIPLGGIKQRSVLALLLSQPNRVVGLDHLVASIWNDGDEDNLKGTLQVHVSNLRKALVPASEALDRKELIATQPPGYRISVSEDELDLIAFSNHLSVARRAFEARDYVRSGFRYNEALSMWRGAVLADLAAETFVRPIATRLERMQMSAVEGRIESELSLGRHKQTIDELAALVDGHPTDERFVGLLMVALYRAGRQADALAAYQACRAVLNELGLDPGQSLRELESRILNQDASLDPPAPGEPDLTLPTILRSSVAIPAAGLLIDGRIIDLDQPITTIGRRPASHVVLADPRASRNHAEIHREPGGFTLVDRGSSNGTSVNGTAVREKVLEPGDKIKIGSTVLVFVLS
ncbi:MAG: BTAD domain-containing putative transcriptional regulator [Actinomycetota bacterium]